MALYNVTNATQLQSALSQAAGGDKIMLAAGNYGSVTISNKNYASQVTIAAAPGAGQVHLDGLFVSSSKNLSFAGLDLGRPLTIGQAEWQQLNWVRNSTNIKMDDMTVHGSIDGDPTNDGVGISVSDTAGFSITNSSFEELFRGVALQRSSNVTVRGNNIENMRSDGIVVAAVDGLVVDNNRFADFRPILPDHADFIQFWNTGMTKGSSNITIKNNVMMQEFFSGVSQTGVQGIFMGDPLAYGYKNVLIQNNVLWSSDAYHGIAVNGGEGVQIVNNTVVSKSNDGEQFWILVENTNAVTVQGNVTDNLIMRDVTRAHQSNNINFAVTPGSRSLLPDLNAAQSELDLLISGTGFRQLSPVVSAPVSASVGSGIGDLLSGATGASTGKTAVADSAGVSPVAVALSSTSIDLSGLKNAMMSAQPLVEAKQFALPEAAEIFAPVQIEAATFYQPVMTSSNHAFHLYDHFTALP